MDAAQRDALLRLVEARRDFDDPYRNPRRIDLLGGAGNFSLVFVADDSRSGRTVVLKVMDPFCRDPYRIECFRRESAMLAELVGQPGIAQAASDAAVVSETLTTKGGVQIPIPIEYYAMEHAQCSLQTELDQGVHTLVATLEIFRAATRSVQRIHLRNIAHRDIKPPNFLRGQDGTIKLSDFGAARSVAPGSIGLLANYQGIWPGDYEYAAPEAMAGIHECQPELALNSDIYSLGAVLFELMTGVKLGTEHLFPQAVHDLALVRATPVAGRQQLYLACVDALVQGYPPPTVSDYVAIPNCVKRQIQELFESSVAVDYRVRCVDYASIFRRTAICEKILRNETAYRRWLHLRTVRRRIAMARP